MKIKQLIFRPVPLARKIPMKLPLSVDHYVSRSAGRYASRSVNSTADRIFVKFYMKLESLKGQKLTKPNFSEKFSF